MFFSTITRDISEQKKISREIEKAYQREKELGNLRANFFSMTSHQFRTPLSTILSSAELLEHYGAQWGEEKRGLHMRRIQHETQRMNHLLDNILVFSRIESVSYDESLEVVDLCEYLRHSIQAAETADAQKHDFQLDCTNGPVWIKTYPEILERIFDNLFTNAVKFSSPGTAIEVHLSFYVNDAVVAVKDYGIGIPEDEIGLVFQPFHRGSNALATPGTGLGLLIVEKSLQILGGGIEIQSKVGVGTTAILRIPLQMGTNDGTNLNH